MRNSSVLQGTRLRILQLDVVGGTDTCADDYVHIVVNNTDDERMQDEKLCTEILSELPHTFVISRAREATWMTKKIFVKFSANQDGITDNGFVIEYALIPGESRTFCRSILLPWAMLLE